MCELDVRGIISSDDPQFVEFFKFLQREAGKFGMVFFADDAEPRETWVGGMHAEDMFGWLVPEDRSDEIESERLDSWNNETRFDRRKGRDFLVVERWSLDEDGELSISFNKIEQIDF